MLEVAKSTSRTITTLPGSRWLSSSSFLSRTWIFAIGSALRRTFTARRRQVREDAARAQDAPVADPEVTGREGEALPHLLHVDPGLHPVPFARDVGEIGGEVHGHHRMRRRAQR